MMPDLPRVLNKREAAFGILFRHYIFLNPQFSCAFELKETRKDYISFSALEDRQVMYLEAISGDKGAFIRIEGSKGEPDYIYLRNFPACVVVKYQREFSIISINAWITEQNRSKCKSLTVQRAREISINTIKLSDARKA